jgi:hypothetical protein
MLVLKHVAKKILVLLNFVNTYHFGRNRTEITGNLHEDLHAFLLLEWLGGESPPGEFDGQLRKSKIKFWRRIVTLRVGLRFLIS